MLWQKTLSNELGKSDHPLSVWSDTMVAKFYNYDYSVWKNKGGGQIEVITIISVILPIIFWKRNENNMMNVLYSCKSIYSKCYLHIQGYYILNHSQRCITIAPNFNIEYYLNIKKLCNFCWGWKGAKPG